MNNITSNNVTPEIARFILWNKGNLSWKLDVNQQVLRDVYVNSKEKIVVWNCARGSGKSYALCVIAIEECLKNPKALVKYCCAKQKEARQIIQPIFRDILEDCPPELRPTFIVAEGAYKFPNGAQIQLSGLDNGRAESLRGGSSVLCIVDEAGTKSLKDLKYIIRSILMPAVTRKKDINGKIILASTAPISRAHPFIFYLRRAEIRGASVTRDVYSNPRMTPDMIRQIIEECGGEDSIEFQREYLCVDEDTLIKTIKGYKKIKDVQKGEFVFTHKGNYKEVLNNFKNKLDDRAIYKVKTSNNLGFFVTKGHKLYVSKFSRWFGISGEKTEWTEVQDITARPTDRIYLKVPIDKRTSHFEDINKAYLAGWYVAEGHCNKTQQQVALALANKDPIETIQIAAKLVFNKEFVSYPCTNFENYRSWYLNSKKAKEYFKLFGTHSTKKRVIDDIKFGSNDVKYSFLNAYFLGDGHYYPEKNEISITSVCLELLADVSDMLLSLDIGCQIKLQSDKKTGVILGRNVNLHTAYNLQISGTNLDLFRKQYKKSRNSISFVKDGYFYSRIKSIEQVNYNKQYVYDIEVKDDHSYVGLHGTFHNCYIITDTNEAVVPEFTETLQKKIVMEWPRPIFFDAYTAMDLGMTDLTVVLFAYYDYKNAKLIIEDEYVTNGQKFTTKSLAEGIKQKEDSCFSDPITRELKPPFKRVSDNNLIVINDLYVLHGLMFLPTRKDDADAALNNMKIMLNAEQIIINPRCTTLIRHLRDATWNKSRKSYDRSPDNGHFDAVDSLKYLVRNIDLNKNPYPIGYGLNRGDDYFQFNKPQHTKYDDLVRSLCNIKK